MSIDAVTLASDIDPELQARIAVFMRTVPDYEEVWDRMPRIALPAHVANFLMISPFTVILGYRLARRPDLLDWIVGLAAEKAAPALAYLTSMIALDLSLLGKSGPDLQWFISTESFWGGCTVEFIEAVIERLSIQNASNFGSGAGRFLSYMALQAVRNPDETIDLQPLAKWLPTHRPN
jgi:hypothetical protein